MRTAAVLLAWAVVGTAYGEPQKPTGPVARIPMAERQHDAGKVPPGAPVTHTFLIGNFGTADLQVAVQPQPGCRIKSFDTVVPPGGIGKVVTELDTATRRGPITGIARVDTNDPTLKMFLLSVIAEVVHTVEVTPGDQLVMVGPAGQIPSMEVTIAATDGTAFEITGVEADKTLTTTATTGSKDRHVVTVTPKPDVPLGRTFASLTVKTSHPQAAQIPIRVTLAVQGNVQHEPDRVLFVPDAPVQHVKVRRSDDVALAIVGVESSDPEIEVTSTPVRPDREYDLAVAYKGKPGRPLSARITVRTNDPRQPTIVIPVAGRT